jgi:hypothetical protein
MVKYLPAKKMVKYLYVFLFPFCVDCMKLIRDIVFSQMKNSASSGRLVDLARKEQ